MSPILTDAENEAARVEHEKFKARIKHELAEAAAGRSVHPAPHPLLILILMPIAAVVGTWEFLAGLLSVVQDHWILLLGIILTLSLCAIHPVLGICLCLAWISWLIRRNK